MTRPPHRSTTASWARFRFSVVGSLLSAPPARGELKAAIRALAAKTWTHPVSRREFRFAAVTIERYYRARRVALDVSQHGQQMVVFFDRKGFEAPLVKMPGSLRVVVGVPTHRVGNGEPPEKLADLVIRRWSDHEMRVVWH